MATDPRKKQKKKERREAKRKEKQQQLVKVKNRGLPERFEEATRYPVLDCLLSGGTGMHSLLFSRELPGGQVACARFLVDSYCLGVKDVDGRVVSRYDYGDLINHARRQQGGQPLDPASARKFVEGAVAYARTLGLAPHPDYRKCALLFGDVDPTQAQRDFAYGNAGKPYFIPGPHDSSARCRQVLQALTRTCGAGNFEAVYIGDEASFGDWLDDVDIEDADDSDPGSAVLDHDDIIAGRLRGPS